MEEFNLLTAHGGGNNTKTVKDHLDRVFEEYSKLASENAQLRSEMDKLRGENEQILRHQVGGSEQIYNLNCEVLRNQEIAKRLAGAINQFIPMLPPDQQASAIAITERAKNVSPQEVMIQQSQQFGMLPGLFGGPGGMHPMMAMMAGMKPEDAMAAMMAGQKHPGMMMPPHPNMNSMLAAAAAAASGQMPPSSSAAAVAAAAAAAASQHPGMSIDEIAGRLNNNRPPRSGSGTPNKKPKIEIQSDPDQELEIDVQNDDAPTTAHTNGTTNSRKDGRESAQSMSSRDSATPKSTSVVGKNNNSSSTGMVPPADMQFLMQQFANGNRSIDPRALMYNNNSNSQSTETNSCYSYLCKDGNTVPASFPSDALSSSGVPNTITKAFELCPEEVVCAVTFAPTNDKVYTGGKGCVKLWDISSAEAAARPISYIKCLEDNYIRSCKLFNEQSWLLVGGEAQNIVIYDTTANQIVQELDTESQACYALAVSNDSNMCFSCCADGKVILWDIRSKEKIASLSGHQDGASCIDISADGTTLWTGGLDSTVRSWDIRERREIDKYELQSQVFSLGCCPTQPYVAVGCESNHVEIINTLKEENEKYIVHSHESCVLSLKFSRSGKYFVTTGKDRRVNAFRTPYGARLVRVQEAQSVLSCDISSDDKYLVTGSGDRKATVYEISLNE
uniref:Groucho/TLE N-terminal Q-rich domain-containing protein n=1 Tax=Panagrolaimus sp. ES5 TaxID=591445 RepID=A0AC34FL06_9BILA